MTLPPDAITLIDIMGNDADIARAARVSYLDTPSRSNDRDLIRYLMRHSHTTPFEMVELKFRIKAPLFVARQWMRHRMASINEVSGRYSTLPEDYYTPETLYTQSTLNHQGSSPTQATLPPSIIADAAQAAFETYHRLIEAGVSREQARLVLPLNTYTEFYWKIDLHNLLHFLRLRNHPHAQPEIQTYARAIATIVATHFPIAYEAFLDYRAEAVTLSAEETRIIRDTLRGADGWELVEDSSLTEREKQEFLTKFNIKWGARRG